MPKGGVKMHEKTARKRDSLTKNLNSVLLAA